MSGENKRNVRPVKVGGLVLDGKKIYIQSMLNVPSTDIEGSVKQAVELEKAGCEIVRAAIPNMEAVKLIPAIKEKISIPLVADIHFDYRLAIAAAVSTPRLLTSAQTDRKSTRLNSSHEIPSRMPSSA